MSVGGTRGEEKQASLLARGIARTTTAQFPGCWHPQSPQTLLLSPQGPSVRVARIARSVPPQRLLQMGSRREQGERTGIARIMLLLPALS